MSMLHSRVTQSWEFYMLVCEQFFDNENEDSILNEFKNNSYLNGND